MLSAERALLRGLPATTPPDAGRARARYRGVAGRYDMLTACGEPYRRRVVEALPLSPGDVVLDVGCGTGLNFARLQDAVGPGGALVGLDVSPDMLSRARERCERHGWENVSLVETGADEASLGVEADAALFSATHDILRSPSALENVLGHVRPGGQVVAGGPKWVSWKRPDALARNLSTWQLNRPFVTTFEGFERPWTHLESAVDDLQVEEVLFGGGFIAKGTRPGEPDGRR